MPPLACGAKLVVLYAGDDEDAAALYHERIALGHIGGSRYFILTPDYDVYEEDYSCANVDVVAIRILTNGRLPIDMLGAQVHAFDGPVPAVQLAELKAEAELLAVIGCDIAGGGAPVRADPPPGPAAGGAAAAAPPGALVAAIPAVVVPAL
eukprot:2560-Heterocapsa_arctica.AAC.1